MLKYLMKKSKKIIGWFKKNLIHEFKKEIDEYKSFLDLLKAKLNNEKINYAFVIKILMIFIIFNYKIKIIK